MQLKVVCAWCGKVMGTREIPDEDIPLLGFQVAARASHRGELTNLY